MVYAIPSYRRPKTIIEKSLAMLRANQINDTEIYVFLSDEEDLHSYTGLGAVNVVYEKPLNGIVEKFNFIHNYFPTGTRVVFVEDDIECLKIKIGENKLQEFTDLKKLAEANFALCEHSRTKLWGISSNANPFYMKYTTSVGFKFIVANLYGFVSTKDKYLEVSQICKSDYERTLLYFTRYGCVVRSDNVCAITKNYINAGGLQNMNDRAVKEKQSCDALVKRFPHLVSINDKKKSIYTELRFKTLNTKKTTTDYYAYQKILDARL